MVTVRGLGQFPPMVVADCKGGLGLLGSDFRSDERGGRRREAAQPIWGDSFGCSNCIPAASDETLAVATSNRRGNPPNYRPSL